MPIPINPATVATDLADLVLEPLPNGELAWLKRVDDQPEPRYWIIDACAAYGRVVRL